MVELELDDFLFYVDVAVDGMADIIEDLGDELVNVKPAVPGANSAYAIVTHCLGVMTYWAGGLIAGRAIERDRAAEFRATGSAAGLVEALRAGRAQLGRDLVDLEPLAAPRGTPQADDALTPIGRTQAGVAMHVYEELAQHLGHLELTRDIVRLSASSVG